MEEVKKLITRRPQNRNVERAKKINWLRQLRERLQCTISAVTSTTDGSHDVGQKEDAVTLVKGVGWPLLFSNRRQI